MSDTKLRCCPFCGGEAKLNYFGSGHIPYYQISCSECGCRQASSIHKESVINTWNTRKPIDRIVESLNKEINGQAYLFNEAKRRGNTNQMAIHEYARQCYEKAVDTVKDGVKNE